MRDSCSVNGKQGDDPLIDILTYGVPVFASDIDDLIRQIDGLGGFESPMAIEYVRTVHELLAWPLQLPALSDYDKENM